MFTIYRLQRFKWPRSVMLTSSNIAMAVKASTILSSRYRPGTTDMQTDQMSMVNGSFLKMFTNMPPSFGTAVPALTDSACRFIFSCLLSSPILIFLHLNIPHTHLTKQLCFYHPAVTSPPVSESSSRPSWCSQQKDCCYSSVPLSIEQIEPTSINTKIRVTNIVE